MSVGSCDFCDRDYVVVVNGRAACVKHLEDAFRPVKDVLAVVREGLADLIASSGSSATTTTRGANNE